MPNIANLSQQLAGKIGFRIGEFPESDLFSLIGVHATTGAFHEERLLEHIGVLDYLLLDSRCQWLSNIDYLLHQIREKLTNHGLVFLYHQPQAVGPHALQQLTDRILVTIGMELLFKESVSDGDMYCFRLVKPTTPLEKTPLPFRYRLADRIFSVVPAFVRIRVRLLFAR